MGNTFFFYVKIQVELLVLDYFDLNLHFGVQGTDPLILTPLSPRDPEPDLG